MNQVVPTQHPAVVLRSHYTHMRTLLAVAMFAVVGLTTTVVILATERDTTNSTAVEAIPASPGNLRSGPDETQRGLAASAAVGQPLRSEGGPDESKRGITVSTATAPGVRSEGGPDESKRGLAAAGAGSQPSDDGSPIDRPVRP